MTVNNQDATFIRRKFTLTETLDGVLTKLAAQNYQGNVSLCLRAAIEDHRTTLEGTGAEQLAVQRLVQNLEGIEKQQKAMRAELESIQEQQGVKHQSEPEHHPIHPEGVTETMRSILFEIQPADSGLRIDDLVEKLDTSPSRMVPALGSLVDLGVVVDVGKNTHRFQLTGHAPQGPLGGE